jgi:hypothetical protein
MSGQSFREVGQVKLGNLRGLKKCGSAELEQPTNHLLRSPCSFKPEAFTGTAIMKPSKHWREVGIVVPFAGEKLFRDGNV